MSSLPPATLPPTEPAPAPPVRQGSLGTVAMALGITGMSVALVPFYGTTFALPLCIAAIVMALIARPRPDESQRHATVGLTTGILGLAITAAWVAVFFGGFGLFGFGSSSGIESSSSISVGPRGSYDMGSDMAHPALGEGDSVTVEEARGTFRTGLSGDATLQLGERTTDLALTSCSVVDLEWDGTMLRGSGPDGTLSVTQTSNSVILDLAVGSDIDGSYVGQVNGVSSSSSSGPGDDHEVLVAGTLHRVADGSAVTVDLAAVCSG